MSWTDHINPADHNFHPRTDDPWWNESSFITFKLPERNMMGMIYHYFRPNERTATGGPWLWDASGADMSVILHYGWDVHMPIPEGADMFDVALPNGLTMQTIEPQKSVRYTYRSVGCEFDLTYVAAREPYYSKLTRSGEAIAGVSDLVKQIPGELTTGHYEQFGYTNGHIVVNGEDIDVVDSLTMNDRSWGPRPMLGYMHKTRVGYSSAAVSPDHAFHIWATSELPWDEDPVQDTTETIRGGFYVKDGMVGELVGGTRQITERGEDGRPIREIIEAHDHLGRTMHAEGVGWNALRWPGVYGNYIFFAAGATWTLDGVPGTVGEIQDYMLFRTYRLYMQRFRSLEAVRV
jgi:hypothetical protein